MSNFLSIVTNGNNKSSSRIFMKPVMEAKDDFNLPDIDKEIEKADDRKKDNKEEQAPAPEAPAQPNTRESNPAPTQSAQQRATQNQTFDMTAEADSDGEDATDFGSAMDQDSFGDDQDFRNDNQIENNFDQNNQNNNLNDDNVPAQAGDNSGGMDFDSAMDPNSQGELGDPTGQMPGAADGELNPQQTDNSDEDSASKFRLMHDFVDLYDLLVDTIDRIDKINPTNLLVSQILSQASINLGDLKENVTNYMTFDIQRNPYSSNLQMYESCVCALKLVVEMLQQTKNAASK